MEIFPVWGHCPSGLLSFTPDVSCTRRLGVVNTLTATVDCDAGYIQAIVLSGKSSNQKNVAVWKCGEIMEMWTQENLTHMLYSLRAAGERWNAERKRLGVTLFIHRETSCHPLVWMAKMSTEEDEMLPLIRVEMTPALCKGSWEV